MTRCAPASSQRIDQWLWYARFFKTRTLAAQRVEAGAIRVNRRKMRKPGHHIKTGDVLTFMRSQELQVIEVLAIADRRGPAKQAQQLYRDVQQGRIEQSAHSNQKSDA